MKRAVLSLLAITLFAFTLTLGATPASAVTEGQPGWNTAELACRGTYGGTSPASYIRCNFKNSLSPEYGWDITFIRVQCAAHTKNLQYATGSQFGGNELDLGGVLLGRTTAWPDAQVTSANHTGCVPVCATVRGGAYATDPCGDSAFDGIGFFALTWEGWTESTSPPPGYATPLDPGEEPAPPGVEQCMSPERALTLAEMARIVVDNRENGRSSVPGADLPVLLAAAYETTGGLVGYATAGYYGAFATKFDQLGSVSSRAHPIDVLRRDPFSSFVATDHLWWQWTTGVFEDPPLPEWVNVAQPEVDAAAAAMREPADSFGCDEGANPSPFDPNEPIGGGASCGFTSLDLGVVSVPVPDLKGCIVWAIDLLKWMITGVLRELFVPTPGAFGDAWASVMVAGHESPLGVAVDLVELPDRVLDNVVSAAGSSCSGFDVDIGPFVSVSNFMDSCSAPMSTMRVFAVAMLRIGLYIGAAFACYRLILAGLGMQSSAPAANDGSL